MRVPGGTRTRFAGICITLLVVACCKSIEPPPVAPVPIRPANPSLPGLGPERAYLSEPPEDMVLVAGGRFRMGCDDALDGPCAEAERPSRWVVASPFLLDRTEVTVAAYRRCVEAEACGKAVAGDECNWGEPDRDAFPINCVTWHQAVAYCAWAGKRLPTEVEWEHAARGNDGRAFPWGDAAPDADGTFRANWGEGLARHLWMRDHWEFDAPVGSFPGGVGPYGTLDQAGNVGEWVADAFEAHEGDTGEPERVVRGGSFREYARRMKTFARDWHGAGRFYSHVGFRCAADVSGR